ncbi:MAG: VanW family protein [Clostridia bacterium]|nr:VanW family protein [Clostridia bacterium]
MKKPIKRSKLRAKCGMIYYKSKRKLLWLRMRKQFATLRQEEPLPELQFTHHTPLLRKLKDVDMYLQYNKVTNLKLASDKINGVIVYPGQTFSFWYLVGKTSAKKGYKEGMVLKNGKVEKGIGGGLCQLTNLIYWMTIHTPLTVTERYRHGYDVFPDSNRTQPFASGATCFYPHLDLMIKNETNKPYQLLVRVGDEDLIGEWRSLDKPEYTYKVIEKNHEMRPEFWGGYSRHNELYREVYDCEGNFVREEFIVRNSAIMMYPPYLSSGTDHSEYSQ